MLKQLIVFLRLVGAHFKEQLQYRVSLFFDIVSTSLIIVTDFLSLALVMTRFEQIKGWNLAEVAFLLGMLETGFSISQGLFGGFDFRFFSTLVRRGTLDQMLLRPVNITLQVMSTNVTLRRLGRFGSSIAILLFALSQLQLTWTPYTLLIFSGAILGISLFFGAIHISLSTITFWSVQGIEAGSAVIFGGKTVISYPMNIYQDWLQRFFIYVLPAAFLSYIPAMYILDKPLPLGEPIHLMWLDKVPWLIPVLAPMVGLIGFMLALIFWRFGLRQYQSTGS